MSNPFLERNIMQILNCGTDIIEIDRIKESIEKLGEKFLNRVFTEKEIEYCESRKAQKYQHYAGRFAAKEACFKALSGRIEDKYSVAWKDFEILNDEQGRPIINIFNFDIDCIQCIDISISHCKLYATANVIVMYKNR